MLPAAVLLRGVLTFAFFGVDAYVPLALVEWRGSSAIAAGIVLTAATLVLDRRLVDPGAALGRWPARRFVRVGFLVVARRPGALFVLAPHPDVPWLSPSRPSRSPGSGWASRTRRSR